MFPQVVKDANMLFDHLDRMVEEVGEANVVQVVTDNASNYVKASDELLMAKRPPLYWTPCAAHCIYLILEDIGKIPQVKTVIKNCIFMNGYIYGHSSLVNMMRKFTNQGNLHRPAVTRLATSFITLAQYYRQRNNLRSFVNSQDWLDSKWRKEAGARNVKRIILQDSFCHNVLYTLQLTGPLVKGREEIYKEAFEIIDRRWNCQLHHPLHAVGYCLNPEFQYKARAGVDCEEVSIGLYSTIERQRTTKSPAEWWSSYGGTTPTLRDFAIKILSLTCSVTGCERNWSVFSHLHTKKRNRLAQERLNDMVFVKYNRTLTRRMDEESDEFRELVFDDSDLTWEMVSRVSRANESNYLTRAKRGSTQSSSRTAKGKNTATCSTPTPRASQRMAPTPMALIDEDDEIEEDFVGGDEDNEIEEDFVGDDDDETDF
ncbi:unnamed protein product [Arabidopsis arenosa]|uniref:HAT C-terminal dimerisation domain-containing protein n=1 Tax=Arabidopsis arenosa TaxID=38785 RepID=A0A8S2A189_ARAAE|nr:unnamed protein product [Arabidopsis arenosa]